jgi:hypothetical protein
MCVGVFNDGVVATTLTIVGFDVKGRQATLQPFEWDHQTSPLPIRLEPGDTWDGYMVMMELAAREPPSGTIEVRPVATGGRRGFRPRRSWRRPWRTTWRQVWNGP